MALQAPAWNGPSGAYIQSRRRLLPETSFRFVRSRVKHNTQKHLLTAFTTGTKLSASLRDGVDACGLAFPLQAKNNPHQAKTILGTGDLRLHHVRANAGYDLASQPWPLAVRQLIGFRRQNPTQRNALMSRHRILTFRRPGYLFAISSSTKNADFLVPNRRTAVPLRASSTAPIKC